MKRMLAGVLLFISTVSRAETVSKWIDSAGQVHYGDDWTIDQQVESTRLDIHATFDENEYEAAIARYAVYEKEMKKKAEERRKQEKRERKGKGKRPLTDAEKYDLYLEQQEKKHQRELERKRKRRAEVRRRWRMDCNDSRNATKIACR